MRVYTAGGWFNLIQLLAMKDIETILDVNETEYFSPRKDNIGKPGMSEEEWSAVYQRNIDELHNCDIIIASTENKDMGTLFECGYATAINKPIIYYAPNLEGQFNLMLAKSAWGVATSPQELHDIVSGGFKKSGYIGEIE